MGEYIGQKPTAVPLTSADIEDGVISTADIGDDQITLGKMASGTDGNIISYDASGNPVAIATGSDGQVLTSTGAGSPPAFESVSAGVSLSGSENNNIATVTGANALVGEARLRYDGDVLWQEASGSTTEFRQTVDGGGTYWSSLIASASDVKLFTRTASPLILGTNNSENMRIDSSGTLFVGATSSGGYNGAVWQDPDGISIHRTNATGGNGALLIYSDVGGAKTNKGYWRGDGGIVNYQSNDSDLSDERLKKNIVDTPSTWETIKELKVRNFKYKTDEDSYKTHIGLIAQETEAIDSTLVNTTDGLYGFEEEQENTVKEANGTVIATSVEEDDWIQGKTDGIYPSDSTWTENEKYRQIYNKDLYFKMLKALQEAITKIETLETKVEALENV